MLFPAVAVYYTLYPSLASAQSFAPGWMLQILIANYIFAIAIAATLPCYLHFMWGNVGENSPPRDEN